MEKIWLGRYDVENTGKEDEIFKQFLGSNEEIKYSFKGRQGEVVFTNKRVIALTYPGFSAKRKQLTFLNYNKLDTYSVETTGTFDAESELKLVIGIVEYEIKLDETIEVILLARLLSDSVL